jgi:hypothetical protein
MSAIQFLATQPWVERLGLTLLHFLWQGAVMATVYAAARKGSRRVLGPNGRYALACGALTAMAIAPVVTWILLRGPGPDFACRHLCRPHVYGGDRFASARLAVASE